METTIKKTKMIESEQITWSGKPKYALSKIVTTDYDNVYVINGKDIYKVTDVQDIQELITQLQGNQGWMVNNPITGNKYLVDVLNELFSKDYIGNDTYNDNQDWATGKL